MTSTTFLRGTLAALGIATGGFLGMSAPAQADPLQPYIGELMTFGGTFCPQGWAAADGQLLAVSSNDALFSLLGTIYGGDGRTTFALPDLRGRIPVHHGTGPGLSNHRIGQMGGGTAVTLQVANLPPHRHPVNGIQAEGDLASPSGAYLAAGDELPYHNGPADAVMDPGMVAQAGGSVSVPLNPPLLGLQWCIALVGIYPSRN